MRHSSTVESMNAIQTSAMNKFLLNCERSSMESVKLPKATSLQDKLRDTDKMKP